MVIGGLGRLTGALWGRPAGRAARPHPLPDRSAHALTGGGAAVGGNLPLAIFGLTLIVVMIAAPGGVQGLLSRLGRRLRARRS
ncbi:hypothetical protein NKG94_06675 [Micromonospora sp. M12]